MREIEITIEQASDIQQADREVNVALEIRRRVLSAVLGGHHILNAEVLRMDTDSNPPVLVIADHKGDGRPMTREMAEAIEAAR